MSLGGFSENLSQAILAGMSLVGRLGVLTTVRKIHKSCKQHVCKQTYDRSHLRA